MIREARPDVIITHFPADYMSDHNEISKLVFDCSFHATLPLFETGKPPHPRVTSHSVTRRSASLLDTCAVPLGWTASLASLSGSARNWT